MRLNKQDYLNDLYLFYRLFIASQYPNSVPAPHINVLAKKLMNLRLGIGKSRLAISMPPRHSKSSMVTLAFPLWLIFQNPNLNIMIITGSRSLAEKFGIQLREHITRLGKYFNIYISNVKFSNTHLMFCDSEKRLYNGNIMLFTSGGGITGQDADYLILDDPYKGNDDEFTPSALQKKIDWVKRVVEQRIEPHTKYCVLHTRWHTNDLIGHYQKYFYNLYDFTIFPALGENNVPLWKERYSTKTLLQKKEAVGTRIFSSVYQQQPLDMTSDFFNINRLHFGLPTIFDPIKSCRAWDIASSSSISKNDYTAGILMYRQEDMGIVKDLIHGRYGSATKTVIQDTAENDSPNTHVVIETGVAAAGELLYQEWKKQLQGFIVEKAKVHGSKSKVDRATPLQNAIEDGKIYIDIKDNQIRDNLITEMTSFPNGEHDDIVDAMAHAYNYLFRSDKKNAMLGVVYI